MVLNAPERSKAGGGWAIDDEGLGDVVLMREKKSSGEVVKPESVVEDGGLNRFGTPPRKLLQDLGLTLFT